MEKCHFCDWEKSERPGGFVSYIEANEITDIDVCVDHLWEFNRDNIENQDCHVCEWENSETNEGFPEWMERNKTKEISICESHMLEISKENE